MNNSAVSIASVFKVKIREMGNNLSLIIAIIIMWVVLSFASPYFLTVENIMNILLLSSVVLIRASGATIAMITGGLDISQNAVGAVAGVVTAMISLNMNAPFGVLVIVAVLVGVVLGMANATLISFFKINAIITTLGTMYVYRGIAYLISEKTIMIRDTIMVSMGRGRLLGVIPISVLIAIGFFIFALFILKYTPYGRKVYMVGGNEKASHLSGIDAKMIMFKAYIISGVTASFAGFLLAGQVGAALPQSGLGTEMITLAAIILGGLSLGGGKGSMWGSLLGILVLSTVNNGLTLLSVNAYVQMVVTGSILILAVLVDVIRSGDLKKK